MKSKNSLIGLFLAIAVFILMGGQGFPGTEAIVSPQIEKALLAEDWNTVVEKIGPNEKLANSPILRALKGHACLALNRNNESLDLFVSIGSDQNRQAWKQWATDFVDNKKYPANAVSFYFRGDALARLQGWKPALQTFSQALSLKKDWYLALNARGVVHYALGKVNEAREDFKKAATSKKDFADAYANLGTLNVYRRSARGVQEAFAAANEYASDSVLVLNGLGCGFYGEQKYKEARKYFDTIPSGSVLSSLARSNSFAAEVGQLNKTLKKAVDAGMSVRQIEIPSYDKKGEPDIWQVLIQEAYKRLEEWEEEYRRNCTGPGKGDTQYCKELHRKIEELKKAIGGITKPKDKLQSSAYPDIIVIGPNGPKIIPGPWIPPDLDIPPYLTQQTAALSERIEKEIPATVPASVEKQKSGGVEGKGVKYIRTSKSRWNIFNVFGLLYNVPVETIEHQSKEAIKSSE